tara:strand:- start:6935 stop:7225 length:291 start_codon:yes stop_codon:yes gene_type:complete
MTYIKNQLGYTTVTSNTSVSIGKHYSATNSITLTLPAVASSVTGDEIRIKNTGNGTITIDSNSSETIDGSTSSYTLDVQYSAITLVSNGSTGWEVI